MEQMRIPKPGEIYNHFKDKLYQIITVAINSETKERMVVYQALYGDFKTYVRPFDMFISEVDHVKYPEVKQKYRFELRRTADGEPVAVETDGLVYQDKKVEVNTRVATEIHRMVEASDKISEQVEVNKGEAPVKVDGNSTVSNTVNSNSSEEVNELLLRFLDAESFNKKLEILTSNTKHLSDRLINDMAVSLDCAIDEGPLDQRIQGLTNCLQAMRRFEDRRLR